MNFYDLSKSERTTLVTEIRNSIELDLKSRQHSMISKFASDKDTYIRKNTYLILAKIYKESEYLQEDILKSIRQMYQSKNEKIRQTMIYAAGEIGKISPDLIIDILEKALDDEHHSVRNAVIGSLKQMGTKVPEATFNFARKHLHHPNHEIRRQIVHGIELRGRTHPEEVMPLLEELQNDTHKKVIKYIVHVIGQISYKEGCLKVVTDHLLKWHNKELIAKALKEIIVVHKSYEKFSSMSVEDAKEYIKKKITGINYDS